MLLGTATAAALPAVPPNDTDEVGDDIETTPLPIPPSDGAAPGTGRPPLRGRRDDEEEVWRDGFSSSGSLCGLN